MATSNLTIDAENCTAELTLTCGLNEEPAAEFPTLTATDENGGESSGEMQPSGQPQPGPSTTIYTYTLDLRDLNLAAGNYTFAADGDVLETVPYTASVGTTHVDCPLGPPP